MKNAYIKNLLDGYLKGFGQILLQSDSRSGILVLAGIFLGSTTEGLSAMMGGMIALATARICRFPPDKIAQGLYGFNAALVSVALTHFFGLSPMLTLVLILGSFLATLFTFVAFTAGIPPYTIPFICITWCVCHWSPDLALIPRQQVVAASTPFPAIPYGLGQVVLQENIGSGALFFLAILIHSRPAALFALGGLLAGTLTACLAGIPEGMIDNGSYGYCAILCALAWVGNNGQRILYAILGVLLSCLLMWLMLHLGYLPLTFPFVASTWLLLLTHIHKS